MNLNENSADPSRRGHVYSYAKSKNWQKLQNPKSKIRDPNSKIQTALFGAAIWKNED